MSAPSLLPSSKKPRGILIAGNWKMNHGPRETEKFFSDLLAAACPDLENSFGAAPSTVTQVALANGSLQVCVIPPSVSLASASAHRGICAVGAQNAHWEIKGAFTGELSGPLLQEIGVTTVLVGHSERRQFFGETNETAQKRTLSLIEQGFRVILCIGETRAEREAGRTDEIVLSQLRAALQDWKPGVGGTLVIAYEPVWAIGTGLTATPEQAEEVHALIRQELQNLHGEQVSQKTAILYGGSVTPDNFAALLSCRNIDGGLVGGASLKPDSFLKLIEAGGQAI